MRVQESLVYRRKSDDTVVQPGLDIPDLQQWVKGLSIEDQKIFRDAENRQVNLRRPFIDSGKMFISAGSYVWDNQDSAKQNKPTDEVWLIFFSRWCNENNIYTEKRMEPI